VANTGRIIRHIHNPIGMPVVVSLEGSVGAGKSTLLKSLKTAISSLEGVAFVDEPVDAWIEHGFLEGMCNGDISPIAFQLMALTSLHAALIQTMWRTPRPSLIITERSIQGNGNTFSKLTLSGEDLRLYNYTWTSLVAGLNAVADTKFVYLSVSPEIQLERIKKRGRAAESNYTLEYLSKLTDLHESWMRDEEQTRVVRADVQPDVVFDKTKEALRDMLGRVQDRLKTGSTPIERESIATDEEVARIVAVVDAVQYALRPVACKRDISECEA
jgi:deoxyadenosine/deoxycytidine kinase